MAKPLSHRDIWASFLELPAGHGTGALYDGVPEGEVLQEGLLGGGVL